MDIDTVPINDNRKVHKNLRNQGVGKMLLVLSEQKLKHLGFGTLMVTSLKPATLRWFMSNGYIPADNNALTADVLSKIQQYPQDFNAHLPHSNSLNLIKRSSWIKEF